MKILFWNVRGIGNLDTRLVIQNLLVKNKPNLIFIAEPWISLDQFPINFWNRLQEKAFAINDKSSFAKFMVYM